MGSIPSQRGSRRFGDFLGSWLSPARPVVWTCPSPKAVWIRPSSKAVLGSSLAGGMGLSPVKSTDSSFATDGMDSSLVIGFAPKSGMDSSLTFHPSSQASLLHDACIATCETNFACSRPPLPGIALPCFKRSLYHKHQTPVASTTLG